jgi:hypothetical protein
MSGLGSTPAQGIKTLKRYLINKLKRVDNAKQMKIGSLKV